MIRTGNKKILALVMSTALFTGALTGCGAQTPAQPEASADTAFLAAIPEESDEWNGYTPQST